MQIVKRTHHIRVNLTGEGADKVAALVKEHFPNAILLDDDEAVEWKSSSLVREIRAKTTPRKLVHA